MLYNAPYWLRLLGGSGLRWDMPGQGNRLYLTFDDGPDPKTTGNILGILSSFGVKATFFCVGENIEKYPDMYRDIIAGGHTTGNHSYQHLKGWDTPAEAYVKNVERCSELVGNLLFRPPYGKMTRQQRKALKDNYDIIMWTVLSRDYDVSVSRERCLERSWHYTRPGAIIVFHDHPKSLEKVEWVLPRYLQRAMDTGYVFSAL